MSRGCKICWTILAVFLIANSVILLLWLVDGKDGEDTAFDKNKKELFQRKIRSHFMQNVGVDSLQYEEMEAMRRAHLKNVFPYQKQIDSIQRLVMNQTFSANNDTNLVKQYISEISELQSEIEYLNFTHYKMVRSRCVNNDQRMRLDSTFRNLIDGSHNRHRRGRGRR